MKNVKLLLFIFILGIVSCKNEKKEVKVEVDEKTEIIENKVAAEPKSIEVSLASKSDSNVNGNVTFVEDNGSVKMTAMINGLEPGIHAIHIHASSDCSSPDGKSAGGHWNPTGKPHGKWGAETGFHKGDIGNFTASENGEGSIVFTTDEWCIGCEDETKNILGKGVIVHAGEDDLTSQPSGAAGARVSCAGIIQ